MSSSPARTVPLTLALLALATCPLSNTLLAAPVAEPKPAPAAKRAAQPKPAPSTDDLIRAMPKAGDEYKPLADGTPGPPIACDHLRARIINGELTDQQWTDLLTAPRLLKYRKQQIPGTPLVVELHNPAWLGAAVAIRATPRLDKPVTLHAGRTWAGNEPSTWRSLAQSAPAGDSLPSSNIIGTVPQGEKKVVFDIEIRTGLKTAETPTAMSHFEEHELFGSMASASATYWNDARVLRKQAVTMYIEPVAAPTLTAAENMSPRSFLQTTMTGQPQPGGGTTNLLVMWWKPAKDDADLGLGLKVDLVRDGKVIETAMMPANNYRVSTDDAMVVRNGITFASLPTPFDPMMANAAEVARYELVFRGDETAAATAWDAKRWWSGTLRRPLTDCIAPDWRFQSEKAAAVRSGKQ